MLNKVQFVVALLIGVLFTIPIHSATAQLASKQSCDIRRVFGRDDSRSRLEQAMLEEARRRVVEQAVGIEVRSSESSTKAEYLSKGAHPHAQWVEDYIAQSTQESAGRITEEEQPEFYEFEEAGSRTLSLKYAARVSRDVGKRDPGFIVDFMVSQDSYREGDTITLQAQSARNCQLYVFNVTRDGQCALIWPNAHERDAALSAGLKRKLPDYSKAYEFIAEINRTDEGGVVKSGQNTPTGSGAMNVQTELMYALFYIGDRPLFEPGAVRSGVQFTLPQFNKLVLGIPRSDRREVVAPYTVTRKLE
jgi:hypothetical protein